MCSDVSICCLLKRRYATSSAGQEEKDFAKDKEPYLRSGSSEKNKLLQLHKREQNAIRIPGEASRRPFQGDYKRYPLIGLGQTTRSTGGLTCEKALCRLFRWTGKRDFAKDKEPHLRCGSSGNSEILIFIESKRNLQTGCARRLMDDRPDILFLGQPQGMRPER